MADKWEFASRALVATVLIGGTVALGLSLSGYTISEQPPDMGIYDKASTAPGISQGEATQLCRERFGPDFEPGMADLTDIPATLECHNSTHAGVTEIPDRVFNGSKVIVGE